MKKVIQIGLVFIAGSLQLNLLAAPLSGTIIRLGINESISGASVRPNDVVVCGQGSGGTLPPPPPPPEKCEMSAINFFAITSDADRVSNGSCPASAISVDRCSGRIEDHAVGRIQNQVRNYVNSIKSSIERECSKSVCQFHEINNALRNFDEVVRHLERSSISYFNNSTNGQARAPLLLTSMSRPFCR